MTINYTTLLGLAQPVTGTEAGTWGDTVNTEITALLEDAIADAASISVTSGDVTLTTTNGAANQARMAILLITGTPGVSRNIIAPSQSKWYILKNSSDAAVVLKGSATTGVTIGAGSEALCFWNGSDFEIAGLFGPSSSTDNAIARFDSTTGKVIQNSGVTIDDSNNVSGVVQLNATTADLTNIEVTNIKAKDGTAAGSIADSTGLVTLTNLTGTTADYTNIEVTNIKAKDGTASATIADSTGVFTHSTTTVFPAGAVGTPSITTAGDTNTGIFFPAADTIAFAEGGAEAMRIDSSGRVGIGTTPTVTLDVSSSDSRLNLTSTGSGQTVGISIKGGAGGGDTYNFVESLNSGGTQAWYLGSNGTANTLAFKTNGNNERMRIDSSGNVGIGTSSPLTKLHVSVSALSGYTSVANSGLLIERGNGPAALNIASPNTESGFIWFADQDSQSVGNIAYNHPSNFMSFQTNGSERMRIDSSGNVLVGTTTVFGSSNAGNTHIQGSTNNNSYGVLALRNSNASSGKYWHIGPVNDNGFVVYNQDSTGVYVSDGGTSWNSNSDERLKDIIEPITDAVNKVSTLRSVIGRYKTDSKEKRRSFLIAQDVQAVLPEAINVQNDEQGTLGLAYTDVIPLLVAAIKELKAELDTVNAELATLKGN